MSTARSFLILSWVKCCRFSGDQNFYFYFNAKKRTTLKVAHLWKKTKAKILITIVYHAGIFLFIGDSLYNEKFLLFSNCTKIFSRRFVDKLTFLYLVKLYFNTCLHDIKFNFLILTIPRWIWGRRSIVSRRWCGGPSLYYSSNLFCCCSSINTHLYGSLKFTALKQMTSGNIATSPKDFLWRVCKVSPSHIMYNGRCYSFLITNHTSATKWCSGTSFIANTLKDFYAGELSPVSI